MIAVTMALTRRNLRIFFHDRMNVFLSLLGALILFLLYTLFLGNLQITNIEEQFPSAGLAQIGTFVDSWMFAGIVLIGTVTTGLGALSIVIDDRESGRFKDFLISPARRGTLVLGYLVSAITISAIMSAVVLVIGFIYLGAVSGIWLSAATLGRIGLITLLCCAAFTALCAFIATFVSSSGAFSALNTLVGTATGFIAVAYIPIGVLPNAVANTASALPFAQAGMLLRQEFAASSVANLADHNPAAIDQLRQAYGLDLAIGGWTITQPLVITVLITMTVIFTAAAAVRIGQHIR